MPRVSVLLTCYNHVQYLPDAIRSLQSQTFTDFEVIAIDDGSTDGSREWLQRDHGLPLRLIFTAQNRGTYGALNDAFTQAQGELIAVFNDDDVWAPRKLEAQVRLLDEHPEVGLVHTNGEFIDGSGNLVEGSPLGFRFPRFETGDLLTAFYFENKVIASAALARRRCFEDLGEFNEAYFGSGDWEMWFRIAEVFDVGCVDEKLTSYRVHGAQASHKLERIWRDDEKLRNWISTRESLHVARIERRYAGEDPRPRLQALRALGRAIGFNWAALGTVRMLNGNPAGARQAYLRSLRYQPLRWQTYARWLLTFGNPDRFRQTVLRRNSWGVAG